MGEHWYEGCVNDREWRLDHLYYINTKDSGVKRFRRNWAQKEFFRRMWYRNHILKVRQLGFSTFSVILALDSCLHNEHFEAGLIDKTMPDAEEKMLKLRLACEMMCNPPEIDDDFVTDPEDRRKIALHSQALMRKLLKNGSVEDTVFARFAAFANGSSMRIGTSLRGGTLQYLHVSEFGYIAAHFPDKAIEILSGGVNAVSANNVVIIETTHEGGKYGENYRLMKNAMEASSRKLMPLEYRFFFFPWWMHPEYQLEGDWVDDRLDDYFKTLADQGINLTDAQKRWYCIQEKTFGPRVKTEYPSTPEEAFTQQVEGAIYGSIIGQLRADGRVGRDFEADDYAPLYVSWDLGLSDYMSLWLIQPGPDGKFYVLDYYSANDKDLQHYVLRVQMWEKEYRQLIALHVLPHDGNRRDYQGVSFQNRLYEAHFTSVVVPRTANVWNGIYATKDLLPHCVFHRRCSRPVRVDGVEYMSGIDALENYQVGPMGANGKESRSPLHDACSHGADAFRTFVEAFKQGYIQRHNFSPAGVVVEAARGARKRPLGVPKSFRRVG